MFKKVLSLLCLILLLNGCKAKESTQTSLPGVTVTINDIADQDLKKTAEGLSEIYKTKPKNNSTNTYNNLSSKTLQNLVGKDVDLSGLHLISARQIGDDIFYILVNEEENRLEKFTIYKNNQAVFSFKSEPLTQYSPIVSIRVIEGKYTVEYLEKMYSLSLNKFIEKQKIWQDGTGEITTLYNLQNAIMPFEANGKIIFLGQKDDVWQIYYRGKSSPETFSSINFGYANEPALYMPRAFNYRYLVFFANQDEKSKIVEVDVGD